MSRDGSVGTATGYGLNDGGVGVRVCLVQTLFGAHPASYPVGIGGAFLRDIDNWFFYRPNPFSRTMALESTEPLTDRSTGNLHLS
jgi:hypothetical protein